MNHGDRVLLVAMLMGLTEGSAGFHHCVCHTTAAEVGKGRKEPYGFDR